MAEQALLFDNLPKTEGGRGLLFRPLKYPLWTENKAQLIARYLYYFVLITKHGAYIDGFAAPQEPDVEGSWTAKLVLESEPALLRDFWLCDIDKTGCRSLESLAQAHRSRRRKIDVIQGDFNKKLPSILASGRIKPKTASFCLIDQRTFECHWKTLKAIAKHKSTNKIEVFYFLGTGWLDRALSAISVNRQVVQKWWGKPDWASLKGMNGAARAELWCKRFREELGYAYATAWPIYKRGGRKGAVMYHMIHGTDHPEAPKIMWRAYRTVTKSPEPPNQIQGDLESLWNQAK